MTFILILLGTIAIVGIGFLVIIGFNLLKSDSLITRLSYSWGLGVGLLVMQMTLYSFAFGGGWTNYELLTPWVIFAIIIFIRQKRNLKIPKIPIQLNKVDWFFTLLIILLIIFVGFEAVLRPVPSWDGWSQWLLRSKIFYIQHFFTSEAFTYPATDYPVVLPLLGTFGFIMMNGINDTYVLFLFFMFYLALAGIFFSTSKKLFGQTPALILTFLLLSLQNLIRHGGFLEVGDADLALAYYIFASTILLTNFIKTKNQQLLLLLSFFLAFTSQTKNDGMPFVIFVFLLLLAMIIKWKKFYYLVRLLPLILIFMLWELYKIISHVNTDIVFNSTTQFHWDQIPGIFWAMCKEFFNFQNWSILWIVFLITVFFSLRYIKHVKIFLAVFLVQWLSYFAVFLIDPRAPIAHISSIIDRLYIQIAPLAVLIIGILISYHLPEFKKIPVFKKILIYFKYNE